MKYAVTVVFVFLTLLCNAQKERAFNTFKGYYPIAERPTLSFGLGNNDYEEILFDAKPNVYYGIINTMARRLAADNRSLGDAVYVTFQPHIRMYAENSKPVKTPSYKFLVGWQRLLRVGNDDFFTFVIESGHYSNGQSRCAFDPDLEDETEVCSALYATFTDQTDLAALLNRSTGNFSTNLTRLALNYRFNRFNASNRPTLIHSFTVNYRLLHNNFWGLFDFGGYAPHDIAIYGRHNIRASYEFIHSYKKIRYSIMAQADVLPDAHASVEPLRLEGMAAIYPLDTDMGFFVSYTYGHDNYNYRFLDSFHRLSFGVVWDWFRPFEIQRAGTPN
ncbi:MAG: hypothetical protein AAF934_10850 [Bacteroidota bacterium]